MGVQWELHKSTTLQAYVTPKEMELLLKWLIGHNKHMRILKIFKVYSLAINIDSTVLIWGQSHAYSNCRHERRTVAGIVLYLHILNVTYIHLLAQTAAVLNACLGCSHQHHPQPLLTNKLNWECNSRIHPAPLSVSTMLRYFNEILVFSYIFSYHKSPKHWSRVILLLT